MHDDISDIRLRLDRMLGSRIRPAVSGATVTLRVSAWATEDPHVPFAEASTQSFAPMTTGDAWGTPWSTTWFRFEGEVPEGFGPAELTIDIGFGPGPGFTTEGLVFDAAGTILKALNPLNTHVPLAPVLGDDRTVVVYLEAAANPTILDGFAPTDFGDIETAPVVAQYRFRSAVVAERRQDVVDLATDLEVLSTLADELPAASARRFEIYRGIDRALDVIDYDDIPGSTTRARMVLAPLLGRPAVPSEHRISAIGHAHIDSAWLWPLRETARKVARTVSNVLALAEQEPELVFAFSSAQQHAWLKEHYPALWERLKAAVARGQVVPVGGMWVESDTVMPSGESMARQFLQGKRFFIEEYGIETRDAWLPDSFGYSAALPQIIAKAGNEFFLSQKPSWNRTNHFPHHSFLWEGIDGTRVFAHLPPVDTYVSELSQKELHHAARNYAEKGAGTRSLVPFGWGDGGGGPTREMLARARRVGDLEGSPTVRIESPLAFFEAARDELIDPAVWFGEIYMEGHRGTLTSQHAMKAGNRRAEALLREAEAWSTTAAVALGREYPYEPLRRLWREALLLQFHDILPGSSIRWVHREAAASYQRLHAELEQLVHAAQSALAGEGSTRIVFNGAACPVDGVEPFGAGPVRDAAAMAEPIALPDGGFLLENEVVAVRLDARGQVVSLVDRTRSRELVPPGRVLNELVIHTDVPALWDAWDIDEPYRRSVRVPEAECASEANAGGVTITRRFGASTIRQRVSLPADSPRVDVVLDIDWREDEKFLRAYFPLLLSATESSAETQFGVVRRPIHENTTWSWAQFEIAAHRFLHLDESGFGVALVNDAIYGHSVDRESSTLGTVTNVGLSLLRAPKNPDPTTDRGTHHFAYGLVVGCSLERAVHEGYLASNAPTVTTGARGIRPLVTASAPNVVVSALKLAEDGSGDVIVRLYESIGRRSWTDVTPTFSCTAMLPADLLERPIGGALLAEDGGLRVEIAPFEVLTLRMTGVEGGYIAAAT